MNRLYKYLIPLVLLAVVACEKEIDIELPEYQEKIVVEGTIEQGRPPIVFLSWSSGYFDPVDASTYANSFIHGADVTMTTDIGTTTLNELCTNNLPAGLDTIVADFLGVPVSQLAQLPICAYTTADSAYWGEIGKSYRINIEHDTFSLTATTQIPYLVPLDSTWFEVQGSLDSFGFVFARMTDPDTTGNAYRWYSKRLTTNEDGEPEDPTFIPPIGSAFDDKFFNGQSFEFGVNRPYSENDSEDDRNGYFKTGDTVAIKFTTITKEVMNFYRSMENQAASDGSPFASPANVETNIQGGGLGVWAGFGVSYDTLICQ